MRAIKTKLSNFFYKLQRYYETFCKKYFPAIYDPQVLRQWAAIFAVSNICTATLFFLWQLDIGKGYISPLFAIAIVVHLLIASRFLKNLQRFNKTSFTKWGWLNLIFISPIGLVLFYYICVPKYWLLEDTEVGKKKILEKEKQQLEKPNQTYKYKKLEAKFNSSLTHLKKINENVTKEILHNILKIENFAFEELSFFQISVIIALSTICKQCKQKNFDNLIWGAHWYEDNFFTFGFRNTKPVSMHNKYLMIVGSIVLDEMNNYKKILEKKFQIKKNLSFSDAKMISLHMGEECKWFINQ
ncbi:hypothetical protein [Mycoplasma suis]|uniref:Uncharacterized protein n=1 Tax=Mycoplasma suis (strain Illinois) TaxID=768700 RepID=F0QSB4_MYCSL|nr:hypothetical protein [Mycoplasma suis]ADX98384.1 Conserved hypothetical protein [Mycoplasma suis str. Illinois]